MSNPMAPTDTAPVQTGNADPSGGQPNGDPVVPDGHRLVTNEQYQAFERAEQQNVGSQKFYETASEHGFTTDDDFSSAGAMMQAVKKSGMSADAIMGLLAGNGPDPSDAPGSQAVTNESLNKLLDERETTAARTAADTSHKDAFGVFDSSVEQAVAKLAGAKADPAVTTMLKSTLESLVYADENLVYGKGHPFAGQFRPPSEQELQGKLADLSAMVGVFKAHELVSLANAPDAPPTNTPAGTTSPSGGTPDPDDTPDSEKRVADGVAFLKKRNAQTQGAALSSAG